jgi:RHS repeat-associated protein
VGGNIRTRNVYALAAENAQPTTLIDSVDYTYSTGIWKDQLVSYDGQSVTYDASGNPTSYMGATMTWTMGRQLASYDKGSLSIDYTYNEKGIRTSKTVNNVRTDYYLNGSQVIAEVTDGSRIDYRYDGNGHLIALRYNGVEYYYVTNIQGDIIGLIDGSGTSVVQYTYDAWGNQTSCTGTLANTLGQANPYRYRGYRVDTETGLYYLQSRYYDANVGRFVNADDVNIIIETLDSSTFNLFIYCVNNPIMFIDPAGYKIIGFGLQIELSLTFLGMCITGGIEIIWYIDRQVYIPNGRPRWIPYLYVYVESGYAFSVSNLKSLSNLLAPFTKFNLDALLKKGVKAFFGVSGSACIFVIDANSKFHSPSDYLGAVCGWYATVGHFKLYHAWSSSCNVWGAGYDTSLFGTAQTSSKYWFFPGYEQLVNSLIGLYSKISLLSKNIKVG